DRAGRRLRLLAGHAGGVNHLMFSADGRALVSAGADGAVRLWEVTTGKEQRIFTGHKGSVEGVAFTPDGQTLASVGSDGTARLWDVPTGKERRKLTDGTSLVTAVRPPDGVQPPFVGKVLSKVPLAAVAFSRD